MLFPFFPLEPQPYGNDGAGRSLTVAARFCPAFSRHAAASSRATTPAASQSYVHRLPPPDGVGVTFSKNVSISFGNGGGATLNIGTDGDPVTFDANAGFSAGGPNNTYAQGTNVSFQPGQPSRSNI